MYACWVMLPRMKYGVQGPGAGHKSGACKMCDWQRPLAWLLMRAPGRVILTLLLG